MYMRYPNLVSEIAKRGIKKKVIAKKIGVSERAFYNKMIGVSEFTWPEICIISSAFFPDIEKEFLFTDVRNNAS